MRISLKSLEEILIQADVGFETVMELIDELKMEVKRRNISDTKDVQAVISEKLVRFIKWRGRNVTVKHSK